jgi:hypothetical protein
MEIRPTQKEIEASIDRIAMTPDGQNLYVFLQRRLMTVTPETPGSALRTSEGERIFASKLIGLMAKGIAESVNRTSSSAGSSGAEQPVVVSTAQPVSAGRPRGAGRRIGPEDRVAGWDRTPEE